MVGTVGNNSRYQSGFNAVLTISGGSASPLPAMTGALWVGSAGNVTVMMQSGDIAIFVSVLSGTLLPICVQQVFASGTTASNILGLI